MNYIDINDLLRVVSRKVIGMGHKKTQIGKVLFGSSCYPMFQNFIDPNKETDFGIKPLEKTAAVLEHELMLVFVDPNKQDPIVDDIREHNRQFVIELEDYLTVALTKKGEAKRKTKSSLDSAVENLLDL
jgi:hypothetical protein